ncbi:DUF742 domain-containing protein [Marinitenerispora sediminis]|uniref:DUF742 domain-containing protein n=1 Tax=Marinitenerispora sediminis TaxID=1931232 RepID=UPI001F262688|nr:DUF742 domain-containing protein [Marinitenerispora sediminis]
MRIRPYTLTGGRTRSRFPLFVHSLISLSDPEAAPPSGLAPEAGRILVLCRRVKSVAEISADLRLPLGVVQVLVGDLLDRGVVRVHPTITGRRPTDRELLQRLLVGLEQLSS